MKKWRIVAGVMLALLLALCAFAAKPLISCDMELPDGYWEAVEGQAKGLYSAKLPLVAVYVSVDRYTDGEVYYTIHYVPFGTVGMAYREGEGYRVEKPLAGW